MKVQTLYNNENISLNKKKTKKIQTKKSVSIKSNIKSTSTFSYTDHLGKVISIQDGILVVKHLTKATAGELVEIQTENRTISGMVLNIEKNIRKIVLFGNDSLVLPNDPVYCTGNLVTIPVGPSLLGRVLDSLGNVIDGGKPLDNLDTMNIEVKAPGIMARQPVTEPVYTGILAIDSMIPVGRGQRELIIGDRQTGKTTIAIDMILNQQNFFAKNIKNNFLYCIYVAIGQKRSSLAHIYGKLKKKNALSYTVLLGATASDPASLQYIAPYAGATIGEWFRDHGYHAVIIYDDLSKQAVAYRQISLLLRRPPTREAYPGDVFYIHSRLLERASKLSSNLGGGSLTAFPIIETQAGDVSAFIPTNVISITDGQIFLETELLNKGIRPAVDVGLSVSRVGAKAQHFMIKSIANKLKLELAQFREVEIFTTFDAELDEITTHKLERGLRLVELTKQGANAPLNYFAQVVIIFSGLSGSLDRLTMDQVKVYKKFVVDTSKYFENFDFDMFALKELQEITLQLIVNYIKSELNFKKTI